MAGDVREFPEPVECTFEQGITIAGCYLKQALAFIESGDTEHAAVWIDSALVWMGEK